MEPETLARDVIASLRRAGHQTWLVGGCVRDLLLAIPPKDFDVVTDARPERIIELFPGAGLVGAHFGVVLVRRGGACVETATFRSDCDYADGRRPTGVRFETDPRQDALRRDFTINALMMDPDSGEVVDYVGGREDLERRLVRAIGDPDARFREDHLRLLRAIRFAARLGFEIEPATFEAIRRNHAAIARVSAERVRDELVRILTEGGARRGFEMLDATGLLNDVLPEVAAMKGVEQPPEYHPEGDVWVHTLMLLGQLDRPSATLAMGALLHDVGKPPTFRVAERIRFDGHVEAGVELAERILARLRFSNEETRQTMLVEGFLRINSLIPKTGSEVVHPAYQMSTALEGLFRKLLQSSKHSTPSTLATLVSAVELLNDLCLPGLKADLAVNPPVQLLVVDDDLIARRALAVALQTAFQKPESAENGETALASQTIDRLEAELTEVCALLRQRIAKAA